jgi:hypothetical protein
MPFTETLLETDMLDPNFLHRKRMERHTAKQQKYSYNSWLSFLLGFVVSKNFFVGQCSSERVSLLLRERNWKQMMHFQFMNTYFVIRVSAIAEILICLRKLFY